MGYVQSSTTDALVLEPGAYGAPAPRFTWSEIQRIEVRIPSAAGSTVGAMSGAAAFGMAGWVVAWLMTWGATAQWPDTTALSITTGVVAGGLIGAICGRVVRRWAPVYDTYQYGGAAK